MNGYAYSDQAWEDVRLTTGTYTAWNNGWVYRNTGVDIEATTDALSNGYSVGWFSAGEWMKYSVQIQQSGTYSVDFRIANGSGETGTVQIQNESGTEILATATIPTTGSWTTWQTITVTGSFGSTGAQGIRIMNISGQFNLNSVNFTYLNSTVPPVVPVVKTSSIIYLKGNNGKYVTFSGTDNLISRYGFDFGYQRKIHCN
ncbi:MAG: carbohydrate-binding protein [Flavobacteriaceae bacterium]|nr:carbohydrate-binding protein [Flavobacteriaceae bacterium]